MKAKSFSLKNERAKEFVKLLEQATGAYSLYNVMHDACRAMAIAIHNRFEMDKEKFDAYEREYLDIERKYGEKFDRVKEAFGVVVFALEEKREDFLGAIMSEIGTTEPGFGQFLTPTHVARLMARINGVPDGYEPGQIIKVNDPACGASVLLIESAEAMMAEGVRQSDLLLFAEDLEDLSFSVSYVQLSLLGYAVRVTRMDSLSGQVFDGPWYTPGYFIHAMPMRLS